MSRTCCLVLTILLSGCAKSGPTPTSAGVLDINTPLYCPRGTGGAAVLEGEGEDRLLRWRADTADQRWGHGLREVAKIRSSKARPVEVCASNSEYFYVGHLTCPDGTKPTSRRSGSAGKGGRCGFIIDRWLITCPDKIYTLFMDMYHCEPDDWK